MAAGGARAGRTCRGSRPISRSSTPRSQWATWGVTRADGKPLEADNLPASLVLPMGRFGPAFLAFDNFKVYTEWNNSLIYSLTAAYYATRLAGAPALPSRHGRQDPGLDRR